MTRRRLLSVHLAIAVLVLGSAWDTLRGKEHWPFSSYPMYSRIDRATTVTRLHFYGVPQQAGRPEIPLHYVRYIEPFDRTRLDAALRKLERAPATKALLRQAATDVMERYESRRRAGEHAGPPLRAIRLYRLRWRIDPGARNVDRPDSRELLVEVGDSGVDR